MCIIISLEWNIQLTVHRYPAKYIQIVVCRLKLMICCFTNLFILKTSFLLPFMTCLKSEYTSLFRFISKSNKNILVVKTSSLYSIPTQTYFLFAIKSKQNPRLLFCCCIRQTAASSKDARCITNQNSISLLTIVAREPQPRYCRYLFLLFSFSLLRTNK